MRNRLGIIHELCDGRSQFSNSLSWFLTFFDDEKAWLITLIDHSPMVAGITEFMDNPFPLPHLFGAGGHKK